MQIFDLLILDLRCLRCMQNCALGSTNNNNNTHKTAAATIDKALNNHPLLHY